MPSAHLECNYQQCWHHIFFILCMLDVCSPLNVKKLRGFPTRLKYMNYTWTVSSVLLQQQIEFTIPVRKSRISSAERFPINWHSAVKEVQLLQVVFFGVLFSIKFWASSECMTFYGWVILNTRSSKDKGKFELENTVSKLESSGNWVELSCDA